MDEFMDTAIDAAPDDETASLSAPMPALVCTDLVYTMIGFMLPWHFEPALDALLRSTLRLSEPLDVYSYCLPGRSSTAVTVLFPSACRYARRWRVSGYMSAVHGLALLALLYPLSKCRLPSMACMTTLRSLYVMYSRDLLTTMASREHEVRRRRRLHPSLRGAAAH
jgi:hypothetical protein